MKKATLLTFLFAVLMIALLVSCNTTPDPLSDETSSEIPTDGITTDAVTTEELTTEEATTAEETLDLDPNWVNDTTPAPYRYLEGLPNDKWYFDYTPLTASYANYGLQDMIDYREKYPYTEECELYAIQTPLRYETEKDGLLFRFDFFEEKHTFHSIMQIRITVVNVSREQVTITAAPMWDTRIVDEKRPSTNEFYHDIYSADDCFSWEEQKLWTADGLENERTPFTLSYGESHVFERVCFLGSSDPSRFSECTHLWFRLAEVIRPGDTDDKACVVMMPIEVTTPDTE